MLKVRRPFSEWNSWSYERRCASWGVDKNTLYWQVTYLHITANTIPQHWGYLWLYVACGLYYTLYTAWATLRVLHASCRQTYERKVLCFHKDLSYGNFGSYEKLKIDSGNFLERWCIDLDHCPVATHPGKCFRHNIPGWPASATGGSNSTSVRAVILLTLDRSEEAVGPEEIPLCVHLRGCQPVTEKPSHSFVHPVSSLTQICGLNCVLISSICYGLQVRRSGSIHLWGSKNQQYNSMQARMKQLLLWDSSEEKRTVLRPSLFRPAW